MAILKDTTINGDLRVNGRITPAGGIYYGICSSAASTQAKEVTIPGITEYYEGLMVRIIFTNNQTYNGTPTLNINGLGAITLRYTHGSNMARYYWMAGTVLDFIYSDGGKFVAVGRNLATTTYYGVTKLTSSVTSTDTTTAATPNSVALKVIQISPAVAIPAEGTSITLSAGSLVADSILIKWNFSASPENQPPCDLSWDTSTAGTCVITNNGGTTSETIQPVFTIPLAVTATVT